MREFVFSANGVRSCEDSESCGASHSDTESDDAEGELSKADLRHSNGVEQHPPRPATRAGRPASRAAVTYVPPRPATRACTRTTTVPRGSSRNGSGYGSRRASPLQRATSAHPSTGRARQARLATEEEKLPTPPPAALHKARPAWGGGRQQSASSARRESFGVSTIPVAVSRKGIVGNTSMVGGKPSNASRPLRSPSTCAKDTDTAVAVAAENDVFLSCLHMTQSKRTHNTSASAGLASRQAHAHASDGECKVERDCDTESSTIPVAPIVTALQRKRQLRREAAAAATGGAQIVLSSPSEAMSSKHFHHHRRAKSAGAVRAVGHPHVAVSTVAAKAGRPTNPQHAALPPHQPRREALERQWNRPKTADATVRQRVRARKSKPQVWSSFTNRI